MTFYHLTHNRHSLVPGAYQWIISHWQSGIDRLRQWRGLDQKIEDMSRREVGNTLFPVGRNPSASDVRWQESRLKDILPDNHL